MVVFLQQLVIVCIVSIMAAQLQAVSKLAVNKCFFLVCRLQCAAHVIFAKHMCAGSFGWYLHDTTSWRFVLFCACVAGVIWPA